MQNIQEKYYWVVAISSLICWIKVYFVRLGINFFCSINYLYLKPLQKYILFVKTIAFLDMEIKLFYHILYFPLMHEGNEMCKWKFVRGESIRNCWISYHTSHRLLNGNSLRTRLGQTNHRSMGFEHTLKHKRKRTLWNLA